MKILPVINNERKNLIKTTTRIKEAGKQGYCIANRAAGIYKANKIQKYIGITRCISDKMWENTSKNELPYIAGALGMLVPLPLVSPIAMGMGFILKCILPDFSNKKDKAKKLDKIV